MNNKAIIGNKYNRLTVKEIFKKGNRTYCVCECECGTIKNIREDSVLGGTKSCGCLQKEKAEEMKSTLTHGMTSTSEYESWCKMKSRCYNPKNNRYYRYGARGIKVCERWIHSFENFIEDMGRKPSAEYSIDRINNDGDYEPSNCKWSTPLEQVYNQSHNRNGSGVTKSGKKFMSQFSRYNKRFYFGTYNTYEEAEKVSSPFVKWFDRNEAYLRDLTKDEILKLYTNASK